MTFMVAASLPPCKLFLIFIWGSMWSSGSMFPTTTTMTRAQLAVTEPVSFFGSCWPLGLTQGWEHDLSHSNQSESLESCLKYWDKRGQLSLAMNEEARVLGAVDSHLITTRWACLGMKWTPWKAELGKQAIWSLLTPLTLWIKTHPISRLFKYMSK